MTLFKIALGTVAAVVAFVLVPEAAYADHLGYARLWMAQRFQRAARPTLRREIQVHRPSRKEPVRRFALRRPMYPAARTATVRRVAHRYPATARPGAPRLVYVYRPAPVVYIVRWPFSLQ
jgi:hypothetical protein